jgi:hypothetical protein
MWLLEDLVLEVLLNMVWGMRLRHYAILVLCILVVICVAGAMQQRKARTPRRVPATQQGEKTTCRHVSFGRPQLAWASPPSAAAENSFYRPKSAPDGTL